MINYISTFGLTHSVPVLIAALFAVAIVSFWLACLCPPWPRTPRQLLRLCTLEDWPLTDHEEDGRGVDLYLVLRAFPLQRCGR